MEDREIAEEVGKHLRELRKAKGLQQADLAKRSGVASRHISRIELGYHQPSILTLGKLGKALGVSPAEFFDDPKAAARVAKREAQFGKPEVRLEARPEGVPPRREIGEPEVINRARVLFGQFRDGKLTVDELEQGVLNMLEESA